MLKRIIWFFFVGVAVFIFLRTFPFEDPSLFWAWLVDASFEVRGWIESFVRWLPFIGDTSTVG